MKTKLYLIFFFVFPLFMSACRGDDPMPDPPVDRKRTVLVYMAYAFIGVYRYGISSFD